VIDLDERKHEQTTKKIWQKNFGINLEKIFYFRERKRIAFQQHIISLRKKKTEKMGFTVTNKK
jgi:hypothetical protein